MERRVGAAALGSVRHTLKGSRYPTTPTSDRAREREYRSTQSRPPKRVPRTNYEIFAAYWPTATDEEDSADFADMMNSIDKYVASRTLDAVEWQNSTLLEEDVAEAVSELKQQFGQNIRVIGSGELVQTLMEHDLVDEYQLMIHPLVLGGGKRLFRDGSKKTNLQLVDTKTTGIGVVILHYQTDRGK